MEQQHKPLSESCKKSVMQMVEKEAGGCFRCSLLSLRVAALERAPHYSSCLTASKAAWRGLIFTHICWIFAQPSPSPHLGDALPLTERG